MPLEFKPKTPPANTSKPKPFANVDYKSVNVGLPMAPIGLPQGIPSIFKTSVHKQPVAPPPIAMPGADLPRAVNYVADYSGCGWWRLGAPELLMNYNQKMIISSLTTMIADPKFYTSGICAVKLQRQATPIQKEFVKYLKHIGKHIEAKVCYEVDDIVMHEDIPMYNRCRGAFTDPEVRQSITDMIDMCDEMVVVSDFMRDYYKSKTNNKKITTIPNYAPRCWFDRFYDKDEIERNYEKNKKRPRILVTGSGTHYDVGNATNQVDDYSHILQNIIKSRKDFQWVFMGGHPLLLKPFIDNGDVEFVNWSPLMYFANGMHDVGAQATVAALADNNFNRAKSFIKHTEAGHLGIPFIGQDLNPYEESWHKFTTGDEMIDQVKSTLTDTSTYMKDVVKHREYADDFWLDDDKNILKHVEFYTTPYGSPDRKYLIEK